MNNWESDDFEPFSSLRKCYSELPDGSEAEAIIKQKQKEKISLFISTALKEHQKMQKLWLSIDHLAFFAAFSELPTARLFCQQLLGYPFCANPDKTKYDETLDSWVNPESNCCDGDDFFVFDSRVHGRKIDLQDFSKFVEQRIPLGAAWIKEENYHLANNSMLFEKIACGFNIWDRSNNQTEQPRLRVLLEYGHTFSNNQGTERAVKDQNEAATNQRKNKNASIRMIASSALKEQCSATILGEKRNAFRGAQRVDEMMLRLREFEAILGRCEVEIGSALFKEKVRFFEARLGKSFEDNRRQDARDKFVSVLDQPHIPSAKEKVEGIHDVAGKEAIGHSSWR